MQLINGMEHYGSVPRGESIFKDSKGYYIVKWNIKNNKEYKKYLSKKWKPDPNRTRIILKCKNKNKMQGCKWTRIKLINKNNRRITKRLK